MPVNRTIRTDTLIKLDQEHDRILILYRVLIACFKLTGCKLGICVACTAFPSLATNASMSTVLQPLAFFAWLVQPLAL